MSLMGFVSRGVFRGHADSPAAAPEAPGVIRRLRRRINATLPKGLYTRSLLIIIIPMVLLQSVVAFLFMERHWDRVTHRLSQGLAQDVAALIDVYETLPPGSAQDTLRTIARKRLNLRVEFLPDETLPLPGPKPFFSLLDSALSDEIAERITQPFWIDTIGRSDWIEIRVKLPDTVLRILARRSQAYASNSHIFLVWMFSASSFLIFVSILFLRNQIRPILQLAAAAENLGKGRDVANFRPRGAREVRRAALAFFAMKTRIERQIEQRTAMLAGVSHDLRTVLTRFRLELAFLDESPEVDAMKSDVGEMQRMLEGYLAFARGDAGEAARPTDVGRLLREIAIDARRLGKPVTASFTGHPTVIVRPDALKRAVTNLVVNAQRFGTQIELRGHRTPEQLIITVDDNGPGVPPEKREEVFRPFLRLDEARNQDQGGSGLGLAIARDVARGHGGEVELSESPLGGLRATLRLPT